MEIRKNCNIKLLFVEIKLKKLKKFVKIATQSSNCFQWNCQNIQVLIAQLSLQKLRLLTRALVQTNFCLWTGPDRWTRNYKFGGPELLVH